MEDSYLLDYISVLEPVTDLVQCRHYPPLLPADVGHHRGLDGLPGHVHHGEGGTEVVEDLRVQAADIRRDECDT